MSNTSAVDPVDLMDASDFSLPAEIFVSRRPASKRGGLGYHRFETASMAIDFAVEHFASLRPDEIVMTVADKRFNLAALKALSRDDRHRGVGKSGRQ
jgi:hypothetical protein